MHHDFIDDAVSHANSCERTTRHYVNAASEQIACTRKAGIMDYICWAQNEVLFNFKFILYLKHL